MHVLRSGKGVLAFFLIFLFAGITHYGYAQVNTVFLPEIVSLDTRDSGFRQLMSDVEANRMRLAGIRSLPEEVISHLTIYQYTTRQGDDLFFIAARCNIPYSALASLNRITNPQDIQPGMRLLLPSCPGLFIPANLDSDLEILIGASRQNQNYTELLITMAAGQETFMFFPGADFTQTERAFFLHSGFRFPLRSYRITSSFGIRQDPITGNISNHQGIDLAAPQGTEVYAAADGTVTGIGFDPIYGNYIVIAHSNGWSSLYGHLLSFDTVLHSQVRSGSLIGRVGSTGQSTGPHLHFELRQNGRALDPSGRLIP